MLNKKDLQDFIARVEEYFKDDIEKHYIASIENRRIHINKWNNENRVFLRQLQKEYNSTEKGQVAVKRRNSTRNRRVREQSDDLSIQDLEDLKDFYCNCPKEWVVDHVIPLSRGGKHHVSNLQYLPYNINARKSDKLPSEIEHEEWYKKYLDF